jgi:hypothetical protein
VLTVQVPFGLDLWWKIPPLSGELIRCQSNHDVYACSRGGVAMSGGDSRVPVARPTWEAVAASCLM